MSLEEACKMLEGIKPIKDESSSEKGAVTKSFLRKVFELIESSKTKDEFLLSVAYMVARNKKFDDDDIVKFYIRLKNFVNELSGDNWKNAVRDLMKLVIQIYYIRASGVDEVCTTG